MGVKFGTVPSSMPTFTPNSATCRPCWATKPQNQPLSKLNTGSLRFANAAGNKKTTFLAAPAAGEIQAPPNLGWG